MLSKVKQQCLAIYVALGGVLWFCSYSIWIIKALTLVLLLISCRTFFTERECMKGLSFFLLIYSALILSMMMNGSELFPLFLWGPVENYLLFVIGYNISKDDEINEMYPTMAILIIGFFCFLTVTNFLSGFPDWISPMELDPWLTVKNQ